MRNISNELSSIDNILHVNHSVFLFTFRFVCASVYLQQVRSFNLRVTREKGSCLCSSCSSSFLHGFFLRPFRVFTLEIDSGVVSLVNRTALLQMSHRNLNTLKVQRHCHVWTKEDKRGIIIKEQRKGKQIKKIWSNINKVDQIFQMSPIYLFFSFHLSCFFFKYCL